MDGRTRLLCFLFIAATGLVVWIAGDAGHRATAFQACTSYSPCSLGHSDGPEPCQTGAAEGGHGDEA